MGRRFAILATSMLACGPWGLLIGGEAPNLAVPLARFRAEGNDYWRYQGRWFTLDSTEEAGSVRLLVARGEQVFAAFRQALPCRTTPARPPRLIVFRNPTQYRTFLAPLDPNIAPVEPLGCFLEKQNVVAVASDVALVADTIKVIREKHDEIRRDLDDIEKQSRMRLRASNGRPKPNSQPAGATRFATSPKSIREIAEKRKEMQRIEQQNEERLRAAQRRFENRLCHESLHAYLENYVYPHGTHDVPRWLNEGLATMFEGAVVQNDPFRVAPNGEMAKRLARDLGGKQPLPLEKVLAGGADEFHPNTGDLYYAHAWGLVYYLTVKRDKSLLGSPALDEYVRAKAKDLPPMRRFEKLVGMPPDKFEKEWREAILRAR